MYKMERVAGGMKFSVESDGYDGLVLMDKSYIEQMDDKLLYAMEIL